MVSNGYSKYLPTIPATEPHTTSFKASVPCAWSNVAVVSSCTMNGFDNLLPLSPTNAGLSLISILPQSDALGIHAK